MNKTAIVIDSTCYMSDEELKKGKFKVIPLSVNFDDLIFKEISDDGTQAKKVFGEINKTKKLPTTSQPTPNDIIKVYQEVVDEGYNKIISLHISEKLSGTTQGVRIVAEQFIEDNNLDMEIIVLSTKSAAQAAGIIAMMVSEELRRKGDLTKEEVEDIIDYYSKNIKALFFAEDLNYLHYGGRLPQAVAATGKILGITPVLTLDDEGAIQKYKVERSVKSGMKLALKLLAEEKFSIDDEVILMTAHIEAKKKAKKMLTLAQESIDIKPIICTSSNMGIVIGNHLGPGAFGIGWVRKRKGGE